MRSKINDQFIKALTQKGDVLYAEGNTSNKHGGRKGDVFMKYTAGSFRWARKSMIQKGVRKLER